MTMNSPSHPGEIIREEVLNPLGLDVTKSAAVLGVTRPALSRLLNEKAALSPEMALRIEKAFGPRADHLMRIQLSYDMARARQKCGQLQISTEYAQREPS